jgi:hypothetical protein
MIMNKIKNKIFPIMTLALVLSLSACLNDSDYDNNLIGTKNNGNQNFVEVHLTSDNNTNTVTRGYDLVNSDVTISNLVPIRLTSGPAKSDVTVTYRILKAGSLVTDATGTIAPMDSLVKSGLVVSDSTKYVAQNTNHQVIIPAGQQEAYVSVKFNPSNFSPASVFVFGIELVSVSDTKYTISNLKTGYVKFNIKNQYDAIYSMEGYRIRPGNATEPIAEERHLSTINATTVQDPKFGNYASYHVNVEVTTVPMVVGGVTCYKVNATPVDGSGAVVGAMFTTFTGDPLTAPTAPANPTEINYYNPVTKTFVLNCYYFSGAGNRIMYEVLVRQ